MSTYFILFLIALVVGGFFYAKKLLAEKQDTIDYKSRIISSKDRDFDTLKFQFEGLINYKKGVLTAKMTRESHNIKLYDVVEMISIKLLERGYYDHQIHDQILMDSLSHFQWNSAYADKDIPVGIEVCENHIIDVAVELIIQNQFPPERLGELILDLPRDDTFGLIDMLPPRINRL